MSSTPFSLHIFVNITSTGPLVPIFAGLLLDFMMQRCSASMLLTKFISALVNPSSVWTMTVYLGMNLSANFMTCSSLSCASLVFAGFAYSFTMIFCTNFAM